MAGDCYRTSTPTDRAMSCPIFRVTPFGRGAELCLLLHKLPLFACRHAHLGGEIAVMHGGRIHPRASGPLIETCLDTFFSAEVLFFCGTCHPNARHDNEQREPKLVVSHFSSLVPTNPTVPSPPELFRQVDDSRGAGRTCTLDYLVLHSVATPARVNRAVLPLIQNSISLSAYLPPSAEAA